MTAHKKRRLQNSTVVAANMLCHSSPSEAKKKKSKPNIAMAAEPTVRVPGIVLASLMFHHLNSDSDVVRLTFTNNITIYFQFALLGVLSDFSRRR